MAVSNPRDAHASFQIDDAGALRRAWDGFVWLLRIVWVCRVSAFSALSGFLLMFSVVQAQDLLADTSWNTPTWRGALFWIPTSLTLFVLWAFPVHYAARRSLEDDAWLVARRLREMLPTEELERLCVDLRRRHAFAIKYVPRVLGLLPFAAYAVGACYALDTLWEARALAEAQEARFQLFLLLGLDALLALLFVLFVVRRRNIVEGIRRRAEDAQRRRSRPGTGDGFIEILVGVCLAVTSGVVLLAYLAPAVVSDWIPRAALIPVLFGSPVLALAWLGRRSHRAGVPLVALVLAGLALVTAANVGFNSLRTLEPDPGRLGLRQIDIADAADRWAKANGCDRRDPSTCTSPALIIAADGGASRASFMTATVVGELLDRLAEKGGSPGRAVFALSGVSGGAMGVAAVRAALVDFAEAGRIPCRRTNRTWIGHKEHADGQAVTSWRGCLQALVSGDYLSPAFIGLGYRDNFAPFRLDDRAVLLEEAWERHYEYVTCGGEVSCPSKWTAIETGKSCAKSGSQGGLCRRLGYLAASDGPLAREGAWVPLLALNSTSVQTGRRIIATDLRSTRASPNGPVALYPEAYDLFEAMSCPKGDRACASAPDGGLGTSVPNGPDLRLSTAALTSARFPVISPAGSFTMGRRGKYGDQLVDGGYFENSGLSTATDIAVALRALGLKVVILSIANEPEQPLKGQSPPRTAATPDVEESEVARGLGGYRARLFGVLGAPFETLYNTRGGHGAEARNRTIETVRVRNADPNETVLFKTGLFTPTKPDERSSAVPRCRELGGKPVEMTKVSMSWWLAPAIQADIEAQLCDERNRRTLDDLIKVLRP